MAVKLSSYRVTAAMDANAYAAGMAQKVAADKAGAASAAQVGAAITATQNKVSQAGDVLTRLSRSYVEGFGNAERFTRAINTLGRGIETGNVPMVQAERILDGIYRKYGLTANAADLLEQGHYQLATAVTALNAKLTTEDAALDANSAAHQRNAAAMRMANAQRTNLVFQLQDIGVSLAGGMNPLLVAMQQGSQISMIYGAGEGGIGRAFSETAKMATGLVSRLWPVAAVVGVLAAGFGAMTTEINRNSRTQVSMGDVLVATWELASERVLKALAPIGEWFAGLWDFIAPYLSTAMNYLIGAFDIAFRNVGTIWKMLPSSLGDVSIQAANAVIEATESMINASLGLLNDFITEANKLLPDFLKMGKVGQVNFSPIDNPFAGADKALAEQMRKNAAEVRTLSQNGGYVSMIGTRAQEVANRPSDKELKKAAEEAERQRKAYADLTLSSRQFIADQQLQAQTLGMTTEAAARLRYEQELLNKAANDNVKLTPAMAAELKGLAAEMAAAEERTRLLTEAYEFGKSTFGSFFSDLKTELLNGTSLWGAFATAGANALQSIADKALEMAANGIWDMIFGAISGGLFGGGGATGGAWNGGLWGSAIFNANGNVFRSPGLHQYVNQVVDRPTMFAFANGAGVMGEAGPEAIMPLKRAADGRLGVVAANSNTPTASNDNGWTGDMHITIQANSEDEGAAAARAFASEMRKWQSSGEGHAFVRKVVNKPGRAN